MGRLLESNDDSVSLYHISLALRHFLLVLDISSELSRVSVQTGLYHRLCNTAYKGSERFVTPITMMMMMMMMMTDRVHNIT